MQTHFATQYQMVQTQLAKNDHIMQNRPTRWSQAMQTALATQYQPRHTKFATQ
jgi:hypothetical protein